MLVEVRMAVFVDLRAGIGVDVVVGTKGVGVTVGWIGAVQEPNTKIVNIRKQISLRFKSCMGFNLSR